MALRIKRNSEAPKREKTTDGRARSNSHIGTSCPASPDVTTKIPSTQLKQDLLESPCSSIKEDKSADSTKKKRKKTECPCMDTTHGQSWQICCSTCSQTWHTICYNLKGVNKLTKKELDVIANVWECPWCYECQIPKSNKHLSIKNAQILANTALSDQICASVSSLLDERLAKQCNSTLQESVVLLENRLSSVASDVDSIRDTQDSIAAKIVSLKDIEGHIEHQIRNQSQIESNMQSLMSSVSCIQKQMEKPQLSAPIQSFTNVNSPMESSPLLPDTSFHNSPTDHGSLPITLLPESFINDESSEQLKSFLESCNYNDENGHSVTSFGTPYTYTGAKSSTDVPVIPDNLSPLLSKVNELQSEMFFSKYPHLKNKKSAPQINSILVNKYSGAESYLPQHADKEITIDPESSIFTLSLGQPLGTS